MSSIRVGIDLVDVDQVESAIAAHGDRYLRRVYTDREVADCGGFEAPSAERLAARFAAKEAAFKALRLGDVLPFHDIEVVRSPDGAPELALHGRAAGVAAVLGAEDLSVSLTHERGLAAAVVALTTAPYGARHDR